MAFIWNDESLAILRENAGILTTEQIAQLLHTNITAVRNMAYRLKLSLRVTAYNHRRIAQVQALYASETLSLKEIAAKTGLTASTVQYIVYVKSKNKPYATTEYVSFETENAVHYRVQKEFVDTERSLLDNISDNTRSSSMIAPASGDVLYRTFSFTSSLKRLISDNGMISSSCPVGD